MNCRVAISKIVEKQKVGTSPDESIAAERDHPATAHTMNSSANPPCSTRFGRSSLHQLLL
jgi:hypothetical protein